LNQRILNLGCGRVKVDNAVNVDIAASVRPDIVLDLDKRPWPLSDNHFDEVIAFDVIEHCTDVVAVMEEIHRVATAGAIVKITVPHFSCANAFVDPTHKHQFGQGSFDFFTAEHELSFRSHARYRRQLGRIIFARTALNKIVWRLANRYAAEYERRWAWMFPAWYLYFELEVMKRP
jgi:SAM-dependent methyltransferase